MESSAIGFLSNPWWERVCRLLPWRKLNIISTVIGPEISGVADSQRYVTMRQIMLYSVPGLMSRQLAVPRRHREPRLLSYLLTDCLGKGSRIMQSTIHGLAACALLLQRISVGTFS